MTRKIKLIGVIAVLASALLVALPVSGQAQQNDSPVELDNKANELQAIGKHAEAIPYARRALEIEEDRSGPNHPNVAILLNKLAYLYAILGRYSDARGRSAQSR